MLNRKIFLLFLLETVIASHNNTSLVKLAETALALPSEKTDQSTDASAKGSNAKRARISPENTGTTQTNTSQSEQLPQLVTAWSKQTVHTPAVTTNHFQLVTPISAPQQTVCLQTAPSQPIQQRPSDPNERMQQAFYTAIVRGKLQEVMQFVEIEKQNVHPLTIRGRTFSPLIIAIMNHRFDIAKYLKEKGADLNAEIDGARPIHSAAKSIFLEMMEYCIRGGINIDTTTCRGQTPLWLVLEYILNNLKDPGLANEIEKAVTLAIFLIENKASIKAGLKYKEFFTNKNYKDQFKISLSKIWEIILELNIPSLTSCLFEDERIKNTDLLSKLLEKHKKKYKPSKRNQNIKTIYKKIKKVNEAIAKLLGKIAKETQLIIHSKENNENSYAKNSIVMKSKKLNKKLLDDFIENQGRDMKFIMKEIREEKYFNYLNALPETCQQTNLS